MANVPVPTNLRTELLVVDNGSTDDTRQVVESCKLPQVSVRYIHEPKKGQCHARNTGMVQARGNIFLWTDDDVRPPQNWIEGMCEPILSGRAHAVAGGVKIATHLERDWMEPLHRSWLASTEDLNTVSPGSMVGANMAFSREVVSKVPKFDTELGPGALGFGDETLFSQQLKISGYKIHPALDVTVEHHFDESRLLRRSFLDSAKKMGRSIAYSAYHWDHIEATSSRNRLKRSILRLTYKRIKYWRQCTSEEGSPMWELLLLQDIYFNKQYLIENVRPRNYEKHGLTKLLHGRLHQKS